MHCFCKRFCIKTQLIEHFALTFSRSFSRRKSQQHIFYACRRNFRLNFHCFQVFCHGNHGGHCKTCLLSQRSDTFHDFSNILFRCRRRVCKLVHKIKHGPCFLEAEPQTRPIPADGVRCLFLAHAKSSSHLRRHSHKFLNIGQFRQALLSGGSEEACNFFMEQRNLPCHVFNSLFHFIILCGKIAVVVAHAVHGFRHVRHGSFKFNRLIDRNGQSQHGDGCLHHFRLNGGTV